VTFVAVSSKSGWNPSEVAMSQLSSDVSLYA
jgi:hypothetical protein